MYHPLDDKNALTKFYDFISRNFSQVQLTMGLYSVYIEDWLQVFPRENFRFVRLEDYAANKTHVLLETIRFLGLGKHSRTCMN